MHFYGIFQTNVLINFFHPLEAITWENVIPANQDLGSTKEGSRLAGMKLFRGNCKT